MRRLFPAAALLALLVAAAPATAASLPDALHYVMLKEGEPIGSHDFRFRRDGGDLEVEVESHSRAKVLFFNFTYDHTRTERWRDGRLLSLASVTDDDGAQHEVSMKANGNELVVIADGEQTMLPIDALPVTLWNTDILGRDHLYSAVDGHPYAVTIDGPERKTVDLGGRSVAADYYRMTGDLTRDLWYAPDGTFLKTRFRRAGFTIEWVLQRPPSE
jgi:hypothetical protein